MKNGNTKVVANVRVGEPDVKPSTPSHVPGVFEGNKPHLTQRGKGMRELGPDRAVGDARRSTGIRPKEHDVIDPRMPRLSPS